MHINPNTNSLDNGNFAALAIDKEKSKIVLLPVPWEATVSYREGTSLAPEKIRLASMQIDLFDQYYPNFYKEMYLFWDASTYNQIIELNVETRALIKNYLKDQLDLLNSEKEKSIQKINKNCNELNEIIYKQANEYIKKGKILGLIGGDHSTPLGAIKAIGNFNSEFGILHIDAHHDLRKDFQGFKYSHGSIFHNVLVEVPQITSLVQVGIRDFCQEEFNFAKENNKIHVFYDQDIAQCIFTGTKNWHEICLEIIEKLPAKVYISLDIDGLNPINGISTGTPVPGGISFNEAMYLFKLIGEKRKIIGFDVVEAGSDSEFDAIVAMRLIYRLCNICFEKRQF